MFLRLAVLYFFASTFAAASELDLNACILVAANKCQTPELASSCTKMLNLCALVMAKANPACTSRCYNDPANSNALFFWRANQAIDPSGRATKVACEDLHDNEFINHVRRGETLKEAMLSQEWNAHYSEVLSISMSAEKDARWQQFQKELSNIKKIADPLQRIAMAYKTSIQYQGKYDKVSFAGDTSLSSLDQWSELPSDTIKRAAKTGVGGVCRHFSVLLAWALRQVAHTDEKRVDTALWPLVERATFPDDSLSNQYIAMRGPPSQKDDAYSVEVVTGNDGSDGHAWVRVHLPLGGHSMQVATFDLDPTFNDKTPAILPIRSALAEPQIRLADSACYRSGECEAECRLNAYLVNHKFPREKATAQSTRRDGKVPTSRIPLNPNSPTVDNAH